MSLETQISLIANPQEFARLCNALLHEEHGDDFLPVDDDQPDAGNDGYLKSRRRMFAMHCFKRAQNQGIEQLIRRKMVGDLDKAIALKDAGVWQVDGWTFVSNYPVGERIANEVVKIGDTAGIDVAWIGPPELALLLQRHPNLHARFPTLQVNELSQQLGQLHDRVVELAHGLEPGPVDFSGVPHTAEQQARLIASRPDLWEHLLLAGALIQGQDALESAYLDFKFGIGARGEQLGYAAALRTMFEAFGRVEDALGSLRRAFEPELQTHAFGAPGEDGDVRAILHLTQIITRAYGEILSAGNELSAVDPPRVLAHAYELAMRQIGEQIEGLRSFVARAVEQSEPLLERLASDSDVRVSIELVLDLEGDPELDRALTAELRRAQRKAFWRPAQADKH